MWSVSQYSKWKVITAFSFSFSCLHLLCLVSTSSNFFAWFLAGILVCRLPQLFLCFIAIFSDCLFFLSASFFFSSHCHLQPGYIRDLVSSPYLKKRKKELKIFIALATISPRELISLYSLSK